MVHDAAHAPSDGDAIGVPVAQRRLETLVELGVAAGSARSALEACARAAEVLGKHPHELSFALIYLLDSTRQTLVLAATSGIEPGTPDAPRSVPHALALSHTWPFAAALPADSVLVLPLARTGKHAPFGVIVLGVNPARSVDAARNVFLGLVATTLGGALASLQADEAVRESEARYRTLFDSMDEGFCTIEVLYDPGGRPIDYRFLEVNGAFERQTGLHDAKGKRMRELAPAHEEHWFTIYGKVASSGEPLRFEQRAEALNRWYEVHAFRVGAPELRHVAILFNDITERKHEQARNQFLVRLDDTVRPLTEPAEITAAAARLLGEHLAVNRCAYADVEDDQNTFNLTGDYTRDVASIVGRYTFAAFGGECLRLMRAGKPFVVEDAETDARVAEVREAYRQTAMRSVICVSLLKAGRLVAAMAVHQVTPRRWRADEITLVENVAARCWESIERSRALRVLRESEARLSSIVEQIPAGIGLVDAAGQWIIRNSWMRDFVSQVVADPASEREHRWRARDAEGNWIDAAQWPGARALRGELDNSGVRMLFARNDGSELWTRVSSAPFRNTDGAIIGAIVVVQDIHAQERAAQALRDSEQRYRALVSVVTDVPWTANAEGAFVERQEAWEAFTGQTWPEYRGFGWLAAIHADQREQVRSSWRTACEQRSTYQSKGTLWHAQTQSWRHFVTRATPRLAPDGSVREWVGACTDVTSLKHAEAERELLLESERAARGHAERVNRLKDEFLATLSHELRTPLNAILGWSHVLKKHLTDVARVEEGVTVIERNARAQAQLISDLLDMSRIISGKLRLDVQRVELPLVLDAAIEAMQPTADTKGVRIEKLIDPIDATVHGDAARLQQVIWNLVSNALKFTPRGGHVQVGLARRNAHVEIVVSDTGSGIKPDFLPFVFERFRQADASITRHHSGLGLGLSIVKQLVELHGGSVHATSAGEGSGSTFVVKLPFAVAPLAVPRTESSPRAPSALPEPWQVRSLQGVEVLVVDDDDDARDLLRRILEENQAEVKTAASAQEADALLGAYKAHIIVSDIGMPGEDGYQFMKRARARGITIPAIALTAFARSEDRTKALLSGYQTHIAKPVEPLELVAAVAAMTGNAAAQR